MTARNRLFVAGCLLALGVPVMASPVGLYGFGQPAPASSATRTVEVLMTDSAFSPTSLDVTAGETVRFVLVNKGQLLHEFNLGNAAMHAQHQKEMLNMQQSGMMTPTGMSHVPMGHAAMGHGAMAHDAQKMQGMQHDDPNSVLVEPGKTAELTWAFSKADNLEFACNVPGHYQSGMVGTINVTP